MTNMGFDREAVATRFRANMRRIGGIAKLTNSNAPGMTPVGFFESDGIRADLLRMLVVFLHATIEDFIRSHLRRPNKSFTFSSSNDIEKALSRLNVKVSLFSDLLPGLAEMAKRRNQIVHRADLDDRETNVGPWLIVDTWQLIHWHLVVSTFHYRLREATGPVGLVEQRAHQNAESALKQNINFAITLTEVGELPREQFLDGVRNIQGLLKQMRDTLRLSIDMFLDAEGKPVEGL